MSNILDFNRALSAKLLKSRRTIEAVIPGIHTRYAAYLSHIKSTERLDLLVRITALEDDHRINEEIEESKNNICEVAFDVLDMMYMDEPEITKQAGRSLVECQLEDVDAYLRSSIPKGQ